MTELRPVLPGPHIKAMPWANEHTDAKAETKERAPDAYERLDAKLTQALSANQALRERAERAELAAADPLTALANAFEPIVAYQRELHAANVALQGRAERAEAALREIRDSKHAAPAVDASECRLIARNALNDASGA